ncbi:hypothetical protein BFS35_002290 [Macrococcoides goetzii]|uniref:AAA+ ATPase domain-containing protein n=1 Tax=Macrococcoides goetzii TaxID=1891097 RepID=A0A2G5NSU6_9STAP|nr:ATP-binding protein [Macrococcus goetzii]RAI82538.1 hypothetical protein BFS35_002290 [Macrococcus goetzii]
MNKFLNAESLKRIPKEKIDLITAPQEVELCDKCGHQKTKVHGKVIIDCHCSFKPIIEENKKRQSQKKVNHFFSRSLINEDIKNASFENSNIQIDDKTIEIHEKLAYRSAINYVQNFSKTKSEVQNLLIIGGTGTGKSYLAYCIAEAIKNKGYTVLYVDIVELLALLRSTFNKSTNQTEYDYMNLIAEVDLLVLDDVGANKKTEWANEKLFDITNKRQGKSTVYTSNLTIDQLKKESDFMIKRSYSRMLNKVKVIKLYGNDKRLEGLK